MDPKENKFDFTMTAQRVPEGWTLGTLRIAWVNMDRNCMEFSKMIYNECSTIMYSHKEGTTALMALAMKAILEDFKDNNFMPKVNEEIMKELPTIIASTASCDFIKPEAKVGELRVHFQAQIKAIFDILQTRRPL